MKLIIAIVRPFTVEKIVNAFEEIDGFPGMTVIYSEGFGQRLRTSAYDALAPFKPNKAYRDRGKRRDSGCNRWCY